MHQGIKRLTKVGTTETMDIENFYCIISRLIMIEHTFQELHPYPANGLTNVTRASRIVVELGGLEEGSCTVAKWPQGKGAIWRRDL